MSVTFDPRYVKASTLKKAVASLGYGVSMASGGQPTPAELTMAPIDARSPAFLLQARDAAQKAGLLLVVGFTAKWCVACQKLRTQTLESDLVTPLWKKARLVYVDLDDYPRLGKAFRVATVPDLLFIAPTGRILDRLRKFERPKVFHQRLTRALAASRE